MRNKHQNNLCFCSTCKAYLFLCGDRRSRSYVVKGGGRESQLAGFWPLMKIPSACSPDLFFLQVFFSFQGFWRAKVNEVIYKWMLTYATYVEKNAHPIFNISLETTTASYSCNSERMQLWYRISATFGLRPLETHKELVYCCVIHLWNHVPLIFSSKATVQFLSAKYHACLSFCLQKMSINSLKA